MNYKIKDLPIDERPREKLKLKRKESLSDEELVAIILKTGNKDESVKDIAIKLIKSLNNIKDLNNISINDLIKIKGIKEAKAITLIAAIELGKRVYFYQDKKLKKITSALDIYELFKPLIIGLKQEKLFAVFLNTKNEIITYETIFVGTQNKSITHPREIFNRAIKNSAMKIIILHNHPTNDTTPSTDDTEFTGQMKQIGDLLKIPIIDHIIIGENNYFSYFDHHML
jgi:DNA repair protein RadC